MRAGHTRPMLNDSSGTRLSLVPLTCHAPLSLVTSTYHTSWVEDSPVQKVVLRVGELYAAKMVKRGGE